MAEIKINVPDENCKGCDFLSFSSYETHYQVYQERYYCQIFKCDIKGKEKCMACKMLTIKKGGAK